jgi:hypothetical protein
MDPEPAWEKFTDSPASSTRSSRYSWIYVAPELLAIAADNSRQNSRAVWVRHSV